MLTVRRLAVALSAFVLCAPSAAAQRHCRKGIPCGGTCISAARTCHVGTPSIATPPGPAPVRAAAPGPFASAQSLANAQAAADSSAPWVASSSGHTYYRRGCSTADRLAPQNLIYLKSEDEAQRAGYSRSRTRGC